MRIAVSGTHFTGKSSLIKGLKKKLPNYTTINEPYHLMEEEGFEFSEPPSIEEFELLINRSIETIKVSGDHVIFDRFPLDYLAYASILSKRSHEEFDLDNWIDKVELSLKKLDLILFIPIEYPDQILVPSGQDKKLRMDVDEKLQELLFDDPFEILGDVSVLEVTGPLKERIKASEKEIQALSEEQKVTH